MTTATDIAGHHCVVIDDAGPPIDDGGRGLVEDALNEGASVVVVPAARLGREFFNLRSGVAGEMLQKLVNYRLALAIVGDVSAYVAESAALRDFIIECDRGHDVIFAADRDALAARLAAAPPRARR
jgi:hypothetical protein